MGKLPGSLNTGALAGLSSCISWEKQGERIAPASVKGTTEFSKESKMCSFFPGEGCVGRVYERRGQGLPDDATLVRAGCCEVLWDVQESDPRIFLRKHVALLSDIRSIVFMLNDDGTLLEFGFQHPNDAQAALPHLKKNGGQRTSFHGNGRRFCEGFGSNKSNIQKPLTSELTPSTSGDEGTPESSPSDSSDECTPELSPSTSSDEYSPRDVDPIDAAASWPRTRSPSPCRYDPEVPSIGSRGHPYTCSVPCKYHWKPSGCKDAGKCTRCHLCRFTKKSAKRSQNGSIPAAWPATRPLVCGASFASLPAVYPFPCLPPSFEGKP